MDAHCIVATHYFLPSSPCSLKHARLNGRAALAHPPCQAGVLPAAFRDLRPGRLISGGAWRLDAFSAYPFATWLPGGADGSTTGTPEVDRPTLVVGNHLLTGKVKFHDDGSTIPGHESGDIIRQTLIPNLSYVYPLGDGLNLNLAMSATSGTATNYHRNWVGRYFGIDTSIAVIEVLPSISYRLSDTLAVGAGLMIDYAEMKARQKLPTAAFGRDTKLQMKGDDMGIGFTLGVVWRPWEGTAFGLGYRSRSTYEIGAGCKVLQHPPP